MRRVGSADGNKCFRIKRRPTPQGAVDIFHREPRCIFGAEAARRGTEGLSPATPLLMLAGITLGALALLPFAGAAAIRAGLR